MTIPGEDLDRLMAVMDAAFDPIYGEAWNRKQGSDSLSFPSNHYQLVDRDGHPPAPRGNAVGFFLSRTGVEEEELLLLAVRPDARGRGLGRILLNELAAAARKRGAQRLFLEMRRGNPAEFLYRNFGFEPVGIRPQYYSGSGGNRIDAITFAKDLSQI